jgi:hypothetical protein
LDVGLTTDIAMALSQRRLIVLASLLLCAIGLSACQTTGAPETNLSLGLTQSAPRAAALGIASHEAQIKSPAAPPKQAARADQPIVIGVAF